MSKLTDRASYLKGLAEGMKLNTEKDSHRLILELIDLLVDTTAQMESMQEDLENLNEYVESIDDDLSDLEDACYGDDAPLDEDLEEDDDEVIAYACPSCGHELTFRTSDIDFDEDYLCPQCGKPIFPELEDDAAQDEEQDNTEDPDEE